MSVPPPSAAPARPAAKAALKRAPKPGSEAAAVAGLDPLSRWWFSLDQAVDRHVKAIRARHAAGSPVTHAPPLPTALRRQLLLGLHLAVTLYFLALLFGAVPFTHSGGWVIIGGLLALVGLAVDGVYLNRMFAERRRDALLQREAGEDWTPPPAADRAARWVGLAYMLGHGFLCLLAALILGLPVLIAALFGLPFR